ncbi:hypothetical protein [Leucobacter sp. W1478]|uniref:hypothetical protein n=1 Tax=Leucobacter sp. W1478 TaxID=3439065 RepID=UPI003F33AAD3
MQGFTCINGGKLSTTATGTSDIIFSKTGLDREIAHYVSPPERNPIWQCIPKGIQDVMNKHRHLQIAEEAFDLIENEIRPFLADGGRLWTKGSKGYPSQVRRLLRGLDVTHNVTHATLDALELEESQRIVEHVIPMKRIIIEIIDPTQADPRSNSTNGPIAGGPAQSPAHLLSIFEALLQKCWVTASEHDRLNRAGRSHQWDAPGGNGWDRYRQAGVVAHRIDTNEDLTPDP